MQSTQPTTVPEILRTKYHALIAGGCAIALAASISRFTLTKMWSVPLAIVEIVAIAIVSLLLNMQNRESMRYRVTCAVYMTNAFVFATSVTSITLVAVTGATSNDILDGINFAIFVADMMTLVSPFAFVMYHIIMESAARNANPDAQII